jgi:hypothetical protein
MTQLSFNVIVGLVVRGLLQALAGWMVTHHLLPGGTEVEWSAAGALLVCTYLWSWAAKRRALRRQDALVRTAIALPATATLEDVHATCGQQPGNDARAIV